MLSNSSFLKMSSEEVKSGFCCIPGLDSSKGEPGINKALQKLWMKIQHLEQTKLKKKNLCSSASQTIPDNDADWSMADLQYNLLVLQIQFVRGILRKKLIQSDPFMKYDMPDKENLVEDATRFHRKDATRSAVINCDKLIQTENGFEFNPHIEKQIENGNDKSEKRSEISTAEVDTFASKDRRPKGLFSLRQVSTHSEDSGVSHVKISNDSHGVLRDVLENDKSETLQDSIGNGQPVPTGDSPVQTEHAAPTLHYRLNLNDVPFILGTSASSSHSVVANIQNIIAMMKTHNKALCGGGVKRHIQRSSKIIKESNTNGKEVNDILKELSEGLHALNIKQEKLKRKFDVQHTKQSDRDKSHDLPSCETEVKRPFNVITSNIPSQFQRCSESSANQNQQPSEKPALQKIVIAEEPHVVPTVKTLPSKMLQSGRRKLIQTLKDFKVQLQEEDITWS